tara:strand:- start:581 stop:907 length:327 start_codon:yes stop_codon:yes gene_type:complete
MKYLFTTALLLILSTHTFAQLNNTQGLWVSQDHEYVEIKWDNTFERYSLVNKTKSILAFGSIELADGELQIIRKDTIAGYNLCYYIGSETLIICKPYSSKAWLFQKIR